MLNRKQDTRPDKGLQPLASRLSARGFTMVEILVVIAIVALLSAIALPGFVSLSFGARDELNRSVRELYSLMRAARIYAATFNVNTAVVYNLDNFEPLDGGALINPEPVMDSVTGMHVRVVTAAAMMHQLPRTSGSFAGGYVPVPGENGQFKTFAGDMVVYLNDPVSGETYYYAHASRFQNQGLNVNAGEVERVHELGMNDSVAVYLEGYGPLADPNLVVDPLSDPTVLFPAHVFKPSGRLAVGGQERFSVYIGPSPAEELRIRFVDPENPGEMIFKTIHMYRSTGRVKIAS